MNELKHIEGRIIISVWMEEKNFHAFSNGLVIRRERRYDNFNCRETQPVNATVVSSDHIPAGSKILIHHNCTHDTSRLFNYTSLSGDDVASDIRYFSILESEAFAWYDNELKKWMPVKGFDFALRVFKPYFGPIQGIEPEIQKNTLLLTTGDYKGMVCHTIKYVDYEIVCQGENQREHRLIRVRTHGDERTKREEEIVCINHKLTDEYNAGKIYAGLTKSDCKPKNELICQ